MRVQRGLLFLGGIWELIRMPLLFLPLLLVLNPSFHLTTNLALIWLGGPQIFIAAGFILLFFYPDRYGGFAKLLAVGKILQVVTGFGYFLAKSGIIPLSSRTDPEDLRQLLVPLFISIVDLIFFFFLLSYKQPASHDHARAELPGFQETLIEEE
ncbi:MAG: hypothetical protein KAU17_06970 [Spirochaetales bacterium]|nr:hypothetical protein [Spirochaetales bacterium]